MHSEFEPDDSVVIVIAPADVSTRIARYAEEMSVVSFRSLDDLDRWRRADASRAATIREDVIAALREIGFELDALSARLRPILEQLLLRKHAPAVIEVQNSCLSRRSLYRIWTTELREGPSRFLRRVRVLHAERLMRAGLSQKEAAMHAGFVSVDHLRRLRARRRREL